MENDRKTRAKHTLEASQVATGPSKELPSISTAFLDGLQQMDPETWSRLVHTFSPVVYRWCRASGISDSDAADVVQDVFSAVARGIVGFERKKARGSFRSWLATITRNKVRDYFRSQRPHPQAAGGTDAHRWMEQQPEDLESTICPETAKSPILRNVLEQVRAEFETMTWDAFWKTTVEGQSATSVAESLGIAVASVYQAKSRILRRLRQRLSELPG